MRLVKLSVQRFQCIESADVEFGPGLNVLYGPNDIGKSSLAAAVRAVLLLQHDSTQHKRYVPWHGEGDPRVVLTFLDAENRYWRIAKTFGGSAGRSSLETSKDGRVFTTDANGRQVDEKIRKMLGWGVNAPGGKSSVRGIPDAFLIQVLLAEQDHVRKILFESSLGDDPDESGRARLTQALGAMAQDPLFKKILDRAQAHSDKAFTATGRRKKTANSPFIELDARIKELTYEHDELEAKIRETEMTEARIRQLSSRRDDLDQELRSRRDTLSTTESRVAAQGLRDGLLQQVAVHEATLEDADDLRKQIEVTEELLARVQKRVESSGARAREAATTATQAETTRDAARARLDSLSHDPTFERRRAELEELQRHATEALGTARHEAERAAAMRKQAHEISISFKEAVANSAAATEAASRGEQARSAAANDLSLARQRVADAEQQLRDATSDDKARAKELRRSELNNRRLTRQSERTEHASALQRIEEVEDALAKATDAEVAHRRMLDHLAVARQVVNDEEVKRATRVADRASLVAQEQYGHLRQLREVLGIATRAQMEAQQHRARATKLRNDEAALRAAVRAVPSREAIASLRVLREELRIAEAQVAVGLAITVRPSRAVKITSGVDGDPQTTTTTTESVSLSGRRQVTLGIDDLVEIEISAGEETARARAASLRSRWGVTGAPVLHEHRLDTVEELEELRTETDSNLRVADEHRRDADAAEKLATQLEAGMVGAKEVTVRITELERDLGPVDTKSLGLALDQLGDGWATTLKKQLAGSDQERHRIDEAIAAGRQKVTRLEAETEGQARLSEVANLEADRLRSAFAELDVSRRDATTALEKIDRELTEIEREIAATSSTTTDGEAIARAALAAATANLGNAEHVLAQAGAQASSTRDAEVQATTRLEGIRSSARTLDSDAVWTAALATNSALQMDHWSSAVADADHRRTVAKAATEAIGTQLTEHAEQRAVAIKTARDALVSVETDARNARAAAEELATASQVTKDECNQQHIELADMKVQAAGANLEGARAEIVRLKDLLASMGPVTDPVEPGELDHQRERLERLGAELRQTEGELAEARGALQQVGGAIVRERRQEITQAIEHSRTREREISVEYEAWKLLVDTLRETESEEGTNLGKQLAVPVSDRFRELTSNRYGRLEMGAHLESTGIHVAGELRNISTLSAGTQDQLATLLRICVAEQVGSSIVLDDHLSQSDPDRVGWFNTMVRNAAKKIQIVMITCRPSELLSVTETPGGAEPVKVAAAGLLHAIDLTRVIRRFGGTSQKAALRG